MSSKSIVVGALVLIAIAGGLVYFTGESTDRPAATTPPALDENAGAGPAAGVASHDARSQRGPASMPGRADAPPGGDPRLAALQVSPDNGLIKFVTGDNGKVIAEIDQDPASPGFGKPTREYVYVGDKVVALTAYRYLRDHVEITRTLVAYNPDGSVAEVKESTNYQDRSGSSR
jgi:hypothetical protein